MAQPGSASPLRGQVGIVHTDGAVKDVDLSDILTRGGVFAAVRDDRSLFEQVRVVPASRAIEWPGEIDLDPDVLYGRGGRASGAHVRRRTVTEPAAA